jgi:hypothetical protein
MEHIHQDINKTTLEGREARAAKANKINRLDYYDLEQIKSLQKALAHERGENFKFRQEVLALLRQRF